MINRSRFLVVYSLIIITSLYIHFHADIAVPTNRSFRQFPVNLNDWQMESESIFSYDVLKILRPTDYIVRTYTKSAYLPVYLYVGYHSGGPDSGPIHSPKHCLPGSGWLKLMSEEASISVHQDTLHFVKAVFQKGDGKEMFLYWYFVRGESLTNEYVLKFNEIVNSIMYSRRDSAFIRVSIPYESDEEQAYASGIDFINEFYPVIKDFLPL